MTTGSKAWKKYLSTFLATGLVLSNASFISAQTTSKASSTNLEKDAKVLNVLSNEKAKLVKQLAEKKFAKRKI